MQVKVEVTKEAETQVRELIKSQKPGTGVRIFVQPGGGGGCGSGCGCGANEEGGGGRTSFGLAFDRPRNGDEVVQVDGLTILVDPMSAEQVNGAKLDYVQGLDQSGFMVLQPNAPTKGMSAGGGGCGCGSGGCC